MLQASYTAGGRPELPVLQVSAGRIVRKRRDSQTMRVISFSGAFRPTSQIGGTSKNTLGRRLPYRVRVPVRPRRLGEHQEALPRTRRATVAAAQDQAVIRRAAGATGAVGPLDHRLPVLVVAPLAVCAPIVCVLAHVPDRRHRMPPRFVLSHRDPPLSLYAASLPTSSLDTFW
jgi:hypothetical protein